MDMKDQRFGIEIEMTGVTREQAAKVAAAYFGTSSRYIGSGYDAYAALDGQGRQWKFMSDASLTPQRKEGRRKVPASDEYRTEMVSPICRYEDIETVQEIIRKLKEVGAITNIMAAKEDLIYKALQVTVARQHRWCRPVEQRFLDEINSRRPQTLDQVKRIWYNGGDRSHTHYDDSRYHCLNLHSVFQKGTVEFRLFNGTLHAGKIKAYIQLCLAIGAQALNQRSASRTKTQTTNEKYTFRTWLLRLGLIGDEFKTARLHLLEHLDGCIAWRDPAQAEAQKERLRQKKEKELEQASIPIEEHITQAGDSEEAPALAMRM